MVGLKRLALALLVGSGVAWGQPSLPCKQEIRLEPLGNAGPTDVCVDAGERIYVLHGDDGFMDIYNKDGVLLEHRGGKAEIRQQLTGVTGQSQWVGRLGKSALLVSESGQTAIRGVLVPGPHSLEWTPLQGQPQPITGPTALARDLSGNFYVWSQTDSRIYRFNSSGNYLGQQRLPNLRRPVQLAIDSQGNAYCLDTWGLHVFGSDSTRLRYEVDGATAMYLTGSDVLALAGREWLRQYAPDGQMDREVRETELFQDGEPTALSINDEGNFFVYLRDPFRNTGRVLKLTSAGKILSDFPQPQRSPVSPDPGVRLDYQGRIHYWTGTQLQKLHPSGKAERSMHWVPSAEPKGQLVDPSDLTYGPDGLIWIADSGNCRLQRFRYRDGWQKPIPVGIRGGDPRGVPRSLAFNPNTKLLYLVVHPRNRQGEVMLQTRTLAGKLIGQRGICPATGDPVVKVACAPSGDIFVYQSRVKTIRGWEDSPAILRLEPKGQVANQIGGGGPGLAGPNDPTRRVILRPQEDLIPWQGKLLVPNSGSVFLFGHDLQPLKEYGLTFKQGRNPVFGDFGGSCRSGRLLYLIDIGGRCLQRVVLPQ